MSDLTANIIANGGNPDNILTCHNFYPQRYTCPSMEAVKTANEMLTKQGISTAMFLSSQKKAYMDHGRFLMVFQLWRSIGIFL